MKTNDLITFLAKGAGAEPVPVVGRRLFFAAAIGGMFALTMALTLIGPLPAEVFMTPTPWMKFAYTLSLVSAAAFLTLRLARPLAGLALPVRLLGMVLLMMLALGTWHLAQVPSDARSQAILGQTWLLCPWLVLIVSLPSLLAMQLVLRGFAPVQLRQTGFACGLLAGAIGATAYAMACPEDSPTFVAVWYTFGIVMTGAVGAISGRWLLRWT